MTYFETIYFKILLAHQQCAYGFADFLQFSCGYIVQLEHDILEFFLTVLCDLQNREMIIGL